jgi:two-component system nitrogen regulation sensor histidine kinase NtrY
MLYKRFVFFALLRIALMLLLCVLATLLFLHQQYITFALFTTLVIILVLNLITYVNRTNYSLSRFFESIKARDLTQSFNEDEKEVLLRHLHQNFNQIIEVYKEARIEKEGQHNFLKTLVEHLGVGLISFNENGEVDIFNEAAQQVLGLAYMPNISFLAKLDVSLEEKIRTLKSGETKLVKIQQQNEFRQLSIRSTELRLEEGLVKLVSIQDIKNELDAQELGAWQKLIRVLTHEIMNSISPITSLSATLGQMIENDQRKERGLLSEETVADVLSGINTIKKRSEGLIRFVDTYRNLTRIPAPVIDDVPVKQLLENVRRLMQKDLKANNVQCNCLVKPEDMILKIDEKLVEQVIINLIKNSIDALEGNEDKRIELKAFRHHSGQFLIQLRDNGCGMDDDIMNEIFTPFFTTRENGSGIGLSISRQIMQLHGGSISVISARGEGTVFTLTF